MSEIQESGNEALALSPQDIMWGYQKDARYDDAVCFIGYPQQGLDSKPFV